MLTTPEKVIFVLLALLSAGFTLHGVWTIVRSVRLGRPAPELKNVPVSLIKAAITVLFQRTIFRARRILSAIHLGLFFGLITYAFVNSVDVLEGFLPGFQLVYGGRHLAFPFLNAPLINAFNLVADLMSGALLISITTFLVRRFIVKDKRLSYRENVLLNPKVKAGGQKQDSLIVGVFVILHVSARLLGQAFRLTDGADPFMPIASLLNSAVGASVAGVHVAWWISLAWVMYILPYITRSKHTHFTVGPINLGLAKQNPRGLLDPAVPLKVISGNGHYAEPGAKLLNDLPWKRLLDAYACVQCNRCQDVCPANFAGRPLSPSALEVNKRYLLKDATFGGHADRLLLPLTETVISPEAVWACTTCYACVRVCPVGNEPMADIVDIRRRMIVEGAELDGGVQNALQSLATNGNWMSKGKRLRGRWATKELEFPVKNATEEPVENLWFVGDTASFDERVVPNTKMVARVLNRAGVDFGILYQSESNAGNDVRRAGEEGLFEQLVEQNLQAFGKAQFKQIVTTDPHSFNTLKNEYSQYGGRFQVKHYTAVLARLFEEGKLKVTNRLSHYKVTFHDPCYLGRYNGGFAAPRKLLELLGVEFHEMPRNCENSFCCGAGGGQIWMSRVVPGERPAENRIREALATFEKHPSGKKQLFIVTCPKDMIMYSDAVKTTGSEDKVEVRDIIQLIAEAIGMEEPAVMEALAAA